MNKGRPVYAQACLARKNGCYEEARDLMHKAATLGVGEAHWVLYRAYANGGLCVRQDSIKAQFHLEQGAKYNHMACVVKLYCDEFDSAVDLPVHWADDTLAWLVMMQDPSSKATAFKAQYKRRVKELHREENVVDPLIAHEMFRLMQTKCNDTVLARWLKVAAENGIACAQWSYHQYIFPRKPGMHYILEASKQHYLCASTHIVMNLRDFVVTPVYYASLLEQVIGDSEDYYHYTHNIRYPVFEWLGVSHKWWHEVVVRFGRGDFAEASQSCRVACRAAILEMSLCLKGILGKDVVYYIARIAWREPWAWWRDWYLLD